MHTIINMVLLFFFFSVSGWILEMIFRSIINKHFINPGFMIGMCLPIYGIGGLILTLLGNVFENINFDYKYIWFFLLSAIVMTMIEYMGGYIYLKYYNIRLWDYTINKFNYKGIICPLFTIIWGVIGLLFYIFIYEHLTIISNTFLSNPYYIFMIGLWFGIFIVDLFVSLNLMSIIRNYSKTMVEILDIEKLKFQAKFLSDKKNLTKGLIYRLFPNVGLKSYIVAIRKKKIFKFGDK